MWQEVIMRKTQSTLMAMIKSEKKDYDILSDIQEMVNLIRESQLAARSDAIKELQRELSEWIKLDDYKLRARINTFIGCY